MDNIGGPITIEHKDLISLLLRENKIHEGNWILMAMIGFAPVNIGQTPTGEDSSPGGAVIFQKVGIQRVSEPMPNSVDAAKTNPVKKHRSTKK
jgi:hypothetical protein